MKFIDEALIAVQSGDGGRGCVSFRREKYVPRGGPDGGDGGKGGDVILKCTSRRRTLYQFRFKRQFKARNGSHGQGKQKTGRNGEDLVIELPPGTQVLDAESGNLIKDIVEPGEVFVVAQGGRGGLGNFRFKSSKNRTPRYAQPGEAGQLLNLKLELKLLADVGLVGLPNAGKSTLISVISSADPKIGSYPFTTLSPNLGVVQTDWGDPFIVADIPGLIKGAHEGAGLGIRFLRHIERTGILVHLIDASSIDPENPLDGYDTILHELHHYDQSLSRKPQLVVLNKLDLPGADENASIFQEAINLRNDSEVILISALKQTGINRLISKLLELFDKDHKK
ncbi:MAG: GTPase ObgE [Desulfobacterales bacterium]